MNDLEIMKKIPKKYRHKVAGVERVDPDDIEGCRYLIHFAKGWAVDLDYISIPCNSIKDIVEYAKNAEPYEEKEGGELN